MKIVLFLYIFNISNWRVCFPCKIFLILTLRNKTSIEKNVLFSWNKVNIVFSFLLYLSARDKYSYIILQDGCSYFIYGVLYPSNPWCITFKYCCKTRKIWKFEQNIEFNKFTILPNLLNNFKFKFKIANRKVMLVRLKQGIW